MTEKSVDIVKEAYRLRDDASDKSLRAKRHLLRRIEDDLINLYDGKFLATKSIANIETEYFEHTRNYSLNHAKDVQRQWVLKHNLHYNPSKTTWGRQKIEEIVVGYLVQSSATPKFSIVFYNRINDGESSVMDRIHLNFWLNGEYIGIDYEHSDNRVKLPYLNIAEHHQRLVVAVCANVKDFLQNVLVI